jgi:hypothetical protein
VLVGISVTVCGSSLPIPQGISLGVRDLEKSGKRIERSVISTFPVAQSMGY